MLLINLYNKETHMRSSSKGEHALYYLQLQNTIQDIIIDFRDTWADSELILSFYLSVCFFPFLLLPYIVSTLFWGTKSHIIQDGLKITIEKAAESQYLGCSVKQLATQNSWISYPPELLILLLPSPIFGT